MSLAYYEHFQAEQILPVKRLENDFSFSQKTVHHEARKTLAVDFQDGYCQLAAPDMKQPILHALTYPDRLEADYGRLDFSAALDLHFEPVDHERFPTVNLARAALQAGGSAPLALNAADEIAVAAFLEGRLGFTGIAAVVEEVLATGTWEPCGALRDLVETDRRARRLAKERIEALTLRH